MRIPSAGSTAIAHRPARTWLLTCAALALAAGAAPALAQEAEEGEAQSQDIIVTALKSGEQKLDRVPIAIQAFSAETLE